MESFAQRLTLLRESKELKKKDLAAIVNVSPSCISQYERGTSIPGHDILIKLSQYFGVSIDFLLGNDGACPGFHLADAYTEDVSYLALLDACAGVTGRNRKALLAVIEALQDKPE